MSKGRILLQWVIIKADFCFGASFSPISPRIGYHLNARFLEQGEQNFCRRHTFVQI